MKNLSIAYNVSKKKKMAKGGKVNESAASEHRPMPEEKDKDSQEVSENSSKKPIIGGDWDQNPMIKRPKTQPIKHPSMAQSPVFKVKLRDQEDHLEAKMPPASPKEQPPKEDNEIDAKKSGPSVPALHMKKMAKGGMINEEVSMHEAEEDHVQHPAYLEDDNDQMRPSKEEIMTDHFAEGGMAHDEIEEEKYDSIAAAIMAKRDRMHAMIDSGALDEDRAAEHHFAEGGKINGRDSIYSDESSQVDLKRNAEEDANMEDQTSFNAMRKENYSESAGLSKLDQPHDSNLMGDSREESEEDKHDMIAKIRSKMNVKRQFSK